MMLMIIRWRIKIRDSAAGGRGDGVFQTLCCSIMLFFPYSHFICNLIRILGRITIRPKLFHHTRQGEAQTLGDSLSVFTELLLHGLSGSQLIRVSSSGDRSEPWGALTEFAQSAPPPCTYGETRELLHISSQHLKLETFTNCRTVCIIGVPADIRTRRPSVYNLRVLPLESQCSVCCY